MKFVDLNFENKESANLSLLSFQEIENSGKYLLGDFLEKFELEFSKDQQIQAVSCVKNATDALYMTFKLLECDKRTIIVPAFGAYPTVVAAIQAGAKTIIAAPIDSRMTLDITNIDVPKDSIIVPVHLYGNHAEMSHIEQIAKDTNGVIVEDCAQSTGIKKSSDSFAAIHSFYPTKPLGCRGDGGAIISNDSDFIEKTKRSRFYGLNEGTIEMWGFNSRMDEWQAAFLIEKLKHYRHNNEVRRKNYQSITERKSVGITYTDDCVFHQFVMRVKDRNKVQEILTQQGIPTMIHYPKMLCDMPWLKDHVEFIKTRRVSDEVISLPIGPHLSESDVQIISSSIYLLQDYFKHGF